MENKLKTIKQHEKEFFGVFGVYQAPVEWSKCGIECPKCGNELVVNNFQILTSNPPQRRVKCIKCNYIGSIH